MALFTAQSLSILAALATEIPELLVYPREELVMPANGWVICPLASPLIFVRGLQALVTDSLSPLQKTSIAYGMYVTMCYVNCKYLGTLKERIWQNLACTMYIPSL